MSRTYLHAQLPTMDVQREALYRDYLAEEESFVSALLNAYPFGAASRKAIEGQAGQLVAGVRKRADDAGAMEAFMQQYDLSSEEGVLLMCLAESLLRIPDHDTAEKLIEDKLGNANWDSHMGRSSSVFVNASTWGLMLTGKMVKIPEKVSDMGRVFRRMIKKSGEPVIRLALRQGMRIMAHQYVMGRTIKEAIKRSKSKEQRGALHSFDMLGEAALTAADAKRYFDAYMDAIHAIGQSTKEQDIFKAPSISIKLSALHPRYEFAQRERVLEELPPLVLALCEAAKSHDIALTIDAEEADRLVLSLDVFAAVYADPKLQGWSGLGLAVQAYQKRTRAVLDWLIARFGEVGRRIPVRLVKGAYWDTEVKRSQERGHSEYPVFTRKASTDVSYLVMAQKLLENPETFYPQFATHNAHTICAILKLAEGKTFEFQRLHGMGQDLYFEAADMTDGINVRVYAPVGSHEDLLPYLVRRLLENGANTSFVNRIVDAEVSTEQLVEDPSVTLKRYDSLAHPGIPRPADILPQRKNSRGFHFDHELDIAELRLAMENVVRADWQVTPILAESVKGDAGETFPIINPANTAETIGQWQETSETQLQQAMDAAQRGHQRWDEAGFVERAACLDTIADLLERDHAKIMAILHLEAGKALPDAVDEVREAVDFCRYYAQQARAGFVDVNLPGPTGEANSLHYAGRGVFVCISPWNFPLAIYVGQIVAALVTGNAVLAKPAEQSTLTASITAKLMHEAGVPRDVLQLIPGRGAQVGPVMVSDHRVDGVVFTGSTETAKAIAKTLAERPGPIVPLIAETGGQNAMIADSSALPEQLVQDVIRSAFGSAGQRCSALRVLFLQEDVADGVLDMLAGAMQELKVDSAHLVCTDVGPVIDGDAQAMLKRHITKMEQEARLIAKAPLPAHAEQGAFVAPHAFEISGIDVLEREVFGPILHVVRFKARDLDKVIAGINATGYGLTLGIHSRIESTQRHIALNAKVGNVYINRNMIGAVVGVQPFGGEGLSGTGPKAGGPNYLKRFVTERCITNNTAAIGGNASLMAME